jgi:hypothetical protein
MNRKGSGPLEHCRLSALIVAIAVLVLWSGPLPPRLHAAEGTDFSGIVLLVDSAAGKLTVKKDGTRFTFVVNDKTRFEGGPQSLADLKKGDGVTVQYQVSSSQYVALKVTGKR